MVERHAFVVITAWPIWMVDRLRFGLEGNGTIGITDLIRAQVGGNTTMVHVFAYTLIRGGMSLNQGIVFLFDIFDVALHGKCPYSTWPISDVAHIRRGACLGIGKTSLL